MPNSIHWCLNVQPSGSKKTAGQSFFLQNGISSHWKYRNLQTHQQKIATSDGFRDLWLRLLRDSGGEQLVGTAFAKWTMGGSVSLLFGWSFGIFFIKQNMKPTFDSWSKSCFLKKKVGTPTVNLYIYKSVDIPVIWTQLFRCFPTFWIFPNLPVRSSGVCILAWNVATSCRTWTFNCFKAGLAAAFWPDLPMLKALFYQPKYGQNEEWR